MQFKLFTIPVSDNGTALDEMNKFLRGHKILAVDKQLISTENSANWCFCISYIANAPPQPENQKIKKDYKNILSSADFEKFSILRRIRKEIAESDAVPAYAIFTDEELAGIALLDEIMVTNLQKVKGIGLKKAEKYGEMLVNNFLKQQTDETGRQPD